MSEYKWAILLLFTMAASLYFGSFIGKTVGWNDGYNSGICANQKEYWQGGVKYSCETKQPVVRCEK